MIVIAELMTLKDTGRSIGKFKIHKVTVESSDKLKEKCKSLVAKDDKINISFRKFRPGKDEKLLANMENDFFKYGKIVTEEDINKRFMNATTLRDLAIFICINNIPVGFGQVIDTEKGYMLGSVGIVSKYRGCGLGKVLVSYIIKASISYGVRNLHLYVRINNRKARKMYSSLGFKRNGYSIMLEIPEKFKDIIVKFKNLIFK